MSVTTTNLAPQINRMAAAFKDLDLQVKKLNRKLRRFNKAIKPTPVIHNGKKPRR